MKSFINSLPSHRKKKSRLKKKYNSRQTTIPFAPSDKRVASYSDDVIERGNSPRVATTFLHSSGEFGAARPPLPPARVSLENEFRPLRDEKSNADVDHADLDVLATDASTEGNHASSSQETMLERRTQIQQALTESLANADFHHGVQKYYATKRSAPSDDVLLSPCYSSSAAAEEEEEEMVGTLGSRRNDGDCKNVDFLKNEAPNRRIVDKFASLGEIKTLACHELGATNDQSFNNLDNTDTDRNDRHSFECNVEGDTRQSVKKEDLENIHTHGDNERVHRNHSLDTDPMTNMREEIGEPRGENPGCSTSKSVGDKEKDGESLESAISVDEPKELLLSTSDVTGCVETMEVARKILQLDPCNDPFDGIDIDLWKSIFEDFKKYIASLNDSLSVTDDNELKNINENEKAFAIFDRGMNVNHCNVVFIYDMIRTISKGIDTSHCRSRSPAGSPGCKNSLDHLAECIDMVFRVNKRASSPVASVSVSISKSADENSTVLKFCVSFESLDDSNETTAFSTIQNPSPTMLPPHLQAMSQVFSHFASETSRTLQWQVGSTRETLAATREGAKDLQRQALALQDELYDAQMEAEAATLRREQAEAELARQTGEFQHMVESSERAKEQYHVELELLKERFESELKDLKAELSRAKTEDMTRRATDEIGEIQNIRHQTSQSTPKPKSNECVLESQATEDPISQSIPRNIEFLAAASVDSDMEGSKGTSYHSKHVYRAAPPGWFGPLQTLSPLRHRALPSPQILNDEHVYQGYGQIEPSTDRKKLTSIAENRSDTASNVGFCQKAKSESTLEKADSHKSVGGKQTVFPPKKKKVTLQNVLKETDNNSEPSFAYQEVVRGAKRQALPGHECDECRKFLDALGKGFKREEIVMKCSRHRARYTPQSTPPDFWRLTFADSVASKKSIDNNSQFSSF